MNGVKVKTTTISLPPALAERVRRLSAAEDRTLSELFREAFRFYEARGGLQTRQGSGERVRWPALRASILQVSRAGRKTNLAAFVARDRRGH